MAEQSANARAPGAAVLSTQGLSRNFGGLAAVRDVSIALHHGELHAVIGPNGAGKTTLVNMLSGALTPSAGRILLAGRDVAGEPAWRMSCLGVGRSFQRTNSFASWSVLENVRLAVQAVADGLNPLKRADRQPDLVENAQASLARVGLAHLADRDAGSLAHGEQRQLEIAMALAGRAKVLLLDEPLAGMGVEESQRIVELLRALAGERAVLLNEHEKDVVFGGAAGLSVMSRRPGLAGRKRATTSS